MEGRWAPGAPGAEVAERVAATAGVHARGVAGDGRGACRCGLPAGAGLLGAFGDAPESWDSPQALLGQRASQASWAVVLTMLLFVGALGLVEVAIADAREARVRGARKRAK